MAIKTDTNQRFYIKIHKQAREKHFPLRAMFELTYRCNFFCRHCYVPFSYRKSKELKTKEVFSLLNQLRDIGCFYLGFTGGEPFIREDIIDILWYAKRCGFELIIYTNGSLINEKIAKQLMRLRPNKVDITIPAMSKDAFERITGVSGSRDRVFSAIDLLHKKGVNLGFKSCVLKENESEIKDIQGFARSLDALHRLDTMLLPRLDGSKEPYRYRGRLREDSVQTTDHSPQTTGTRRKSGFETCRRETVDRGPWTEDLFKCGVGVSQAAITPLGELKMCLMIDYPKYKILNKHVTRSTSHATRQESGLKDAWERLKKLVEDIKPDEDYKCDKCELAPFCKWCPARAWLEDCSFTSCAPESKRRAEYNRRIEAKEGGICKMLTKIGIITWGGIGDGLLATPAIRTIKEQNPKLKVYCVINENHKELFENNPYIDRFSVFPEISALKDIKKCNIFYLNYGKFKPNINCNEHAVDIIASMLNVRLKNKKLDIFLTEEDESFAKNIIKKYNNNIIILQIKSFCSDNKDWFLGRWKKVVEELKGNYTFIQLGLKGEPLVKGAINMVGKTTKRQAVALVKRSKLFLGLVSFLSHATNAVGTPAVILFGASTPKIWGYDHNTNIYKKVECSPCIDILDSKSCPNRKCMKAITVEEVVNAVEKVAGCKYNVFKRKITIR